MCTTFSLPGTEAPYFRFGGKNWAAEGWTGTTVTSFTSVMWWFIWCYVDWGTPCPLFSLSLSHLCYFCIQGERRNGNWRSEGWSFFSGKKTEVLFMCLNMNMEFGHIEKCKILDNLWISLAAMTMVDCFSKLGK